MLRAFEKEVRHSKKKREPWREAVDCEWRPTNPSSLSEYRPGAGSWREPHRLLFSPRRNSGKAVGTVANQGQVVRNRLRADTKLVNHPLLISLSHRPASQL